jgi:hypothetical protein
MGMRPTRAPEQIELLQIAADLVLLHTAAHWKHTAWQHYQRLLAETSSLVPGQSQECWVPLAVLQSLHACGYLVLMTQAHVVAAILRRRLVADLLQPLCTAIHQHTDQP